MGGIPLSESWSAVGLERSAVSFQRSARGESPHFSPRWGEPASLPPLRGRAAVRGGHARRRDSSPRPKKGCSKAAHANECNWKGAGSSHAPRTIREHLRRSRLRQVERGWVRLVPGDRALGGASLGSSRRRERGSRRRSLGSSRRQRVEGLGNYRRPISRMGGNLGYLGSSFQGDEFENRSLGSSRLGDRPADWVRFVDPVERDERRHWVRLVDASGSTRQAIGFGSHSEWQIGRSGLVFPDPRATTTSHDLLIGFVSRRASGKAQGNWVRLSPRQSGQRSARRPAEIGFVFPPLF